MFKKALFTFKRIWHILCLFHNNIPVLKGVTKQSILIVQLKKFLTEAIIILPVTGFTSNKIHSQYK